MTKNNWSVTGKNRRAGVLVPLFSIYSEKSVGIGDFSDLRLAIDWCELTGNSILQLLPMNDTGYTFCPYDATSSFALESAYISLDDVSPSGNGIVSKAVTMLRKSFQNKGNSSSVDYRIKDAKIELLRRIYALEKGALDSKDFKSFCADNAYWLDDFAAFKALKLRSGGKPWYEWDVPYRDREEAAMKSFLRANAEEMNFQRWIQWLSFKQFANARKYAKTKKVLIKGDLPILISRDSADVWSRRDYFKMDNAAGAPPDMYCAKGQRWGMPTYDWEKIASDDYDYLKKKLNFAANFYDMLRVDHVVGLFRIWSIPYGDPEENEGLNGVFDPKEENLWAGHGKKLLSVMLGESKMLLCAEDLGMIPNACTEALKEFAIPGNEVQRWVKDWAVTHDFLPSEKYRAMSVSMLSTHDTTNWAAWWENEAGTVDEALFRRKCEDRGIDYEAVTRQLFDPDLSKHGRLRWLTIVSSREVLINVLGKKAEELADFIELYENTFKEKEKLSAMLGQKGPMPERSSEKLVEKAIEITLESKSIFSINLILDYLYLADVFKGDPYGYRINRPGTVNPNNWSLRLPISMESMLKHKVCKKIKEMIKLSGRI